MVYPTDRKPARMTQNRAFSCAVNWHLKMVMGAIGTLTSSFYQVLSKKEELETPELELAYKAMRDSMWVLTVAIKSHRDNIKTFNNLRKEATAQRKLREKK